MQFDHNPALEFRPINPVTGDTIPPANDASYIDMLLVAEHKTKTFGRGGEKRITTADGDIGKIAKMRRITKQQEAFRRRLLAKETGETLPEPRSKWPKRKLSGRKPKRGEGEPQ